MTNPTDKSGAKASAGMAVRALLRRAFKGALATLEPATGAPYASLVTIATAADGTPLMLLSQLAVHTRNLKADPRASLMIDGTGAAGDPLAGGRVSLVGRIEVTSEPADRRRFLARHRDAETYASFADFAFYALRVKGAHYVGGFGRIVDLAAHDVLIDPSGAERLIEAEDGILAHMNADHAALALYAAQATGRPAEAGEWRMSGIDPEGCDLVCTDETARIAFGSRIATPGELQQELRRLAEAEGKRAAQ